MFADEPGYAEDESTFGTDDTGASDEYPGDAYAGEETGAAGGLGEANVESGDGAVDLKAQEMSYEALFATAPARPWFQGMFICWCDNPSTEDWGGGADDSGYTPNGKPAGDLLETHYKNYEKGG